MIVTIKYRAKLTWTEYENNERYRERHENVMCDVVHEIDTDTLQTTKFDFEPMRKAKI